MVRLLIENVLLFLAPTALYVGYVMLVRRTGQPAATVLNEAPLVWLFVAGISVIVLTLLVFGGYGAREEGPAGSAYEPPQYKDGKIVPGRVK